MHAHILNGVSHHLYKHILYMSHVLNSISAAANIIFSMKFGRRDLRRSLSGAELDAQDDFDVSFAAALQKPRQIIKKLDSQSKTSASKNETSGLVQNTFWQSFAPIRALFKT